MGWLNSHKNDKPEYTALQINTSASILAIPIVWGTSKIAPNIVFYDNFQPRLGHSNGKGSGKGGGSSSSSDQYLYSCDLVLALCEGPISGIGDVWKDRAIFGEVGNYVPIWNQEDNSVSYLWVYSGTAGQQTWGYFAALYPNDALAFSSTAYLAAADYDLGSGATIGTFGVEVHGIFSGTAINGVDADPALVINDFLTNPQYGAQFDGSLIDLSTLLSADGAGATVQDYCKAMGLSFSPALVDQEQASSILTRWLKLLNVEAVWSGAKLRFIPYGDQPISAGATVTSTVTETIPSNPDNIPNGFGFSEIALALPGAFVADGGVRYATEYYGVSMIYIGATIPFAPGQYGRIGTTYYFSTYDIGVAVEITFSYMTEAGYTPNLSPIYTLTDDDYVDDGGEDQDPLTVERVDPFSLATIQRVECLSRNCEYTSVPIEARDQSQIEIYGPRVATSITAREICDEVNVGPIVAQAILQRELYVRANFKFKANWTLCLLDPMDIIGLTDAALNLNNFLVRVVSIEEGDDGVLEFTCEELVAGVSTPPSYPTASITYEPVNRAQTARAINTPLVYEPPAALTGSSTDVMLGVSSSLPSGAADPNFGGAYVWASLDGSTYDQVATIKGVTPQGFLTASCAAASGWDTTNTIAVNLVESGGTLSTTTLASAQLGATLCLVDNELLSFETATLTAPNCYSLSGLQRGLYGTTPTAHVAGASFAYLASSAVLTETIPAAWIGQTVWLKFQSFNIFGAGVQDLSTCVAYPFNSSGAGVAHPIAVQLATGVSLDLGSVSTAATIADDFGQVIAGATGTVDLGTVSLDSIMQQILVALPSGTVDLGTITGAVTKRDDWGSVTIAVLDSAALGTAP